MTDPYSLEENLSLAREAEQGENWKLAHSYYRRALTICTNDSEALLGLNRVVMKATGFISQPQLDSLRVLVERPKHRAEAISWLKTFQQDFAPCPDVLFLAGELQFILGDETKAQEFYTRTVELDPLFILASSRVRSVHFAHELENYIPSPLTGPIVLNINLRNFATVRVGDMIAIINLLSHLRTRENNVDIKAHLTDEALHTADYCHKFREFLLEGTTYFSPNPGTKNFPTFYMNLWDYKLHVGEYAILLNSTPRENKICIFPLTDAPYNTYRNWPSYLIQQIVDRFSAPEYAGYEKILCAQAPPKFVNTKEFKLSSDFNTNLNHILTCSHFVGGDTGVTHFASVLEPPPKLIYYMHVKREMHTQPMHINRGEMNLFGNV